MQFGQKSSEISAGRVALELLLLLAHALLLGVAAAVVLAGLVVWVVIVTP